MFSLRTRNECFSKIFTAAQEFSLVFPIVTLQTLITQVQSELCCGQSAGTVFCKSYITDYFYDFLRFKCE